MGTNEQYSSTKKIIVYDNCCLDKSPIYLKTKAQKSARRGKCETVKDFYRHPCALSIEHS